MISVIVYYYSDAKLILISEVHHFKFPHTRARVCQITFGVRAIALTCCLHVSRNSFPFSFFSLFCLHSRTFFFVQSHLSANNVALWALGTKKIFTNPLPILIPPAWSLFPLSLSSSNQFTFTNNFFLGDGNSYQLENV